MVTVSGNMAYEIGDYQLTTNDASGKPATSKGKYVVIWGKQSDGSWKALVDAPTTTQ
jgi:ketosteroid isomerase-like protein